MSDVLYCKLYLTCDDPWTDAAATVAAAVAATAVFGDMAVSTVVRRNDGFVPSRLGDYDCIEDACYSVEIDADEEEPGRLADFIAGVGSLVMSLRARGWVVTVSSDFEEEITNRTGWNWTEAAPNPPGWRRAG